MALSPASQPAREPINIAPILVVGILLLAGVGGFWWMSNNAPSGGRTMTLTPEAKSYVSNLKLAGVELKANESYFGQTVVEITGQITNSGGRELKRVDLYCVFYDAYNHVVLREPVSIVRAREGVLTPGETRAFRLPFDNLPSSWNQAMPQLVIGQILF